MPCLRAWYCVSVDPAQEPQDSRAGTPQVSVPDCGLQAPRRAADQAQSSDVGTGRLGWGEVGWTGDSLLIHPLTSANYVTVFLQLIFQAANGPGCMKRLTEILDRMERMFSALSG